MCYYMSKNTKENIMGHKFSQSTVTFIYSIAQGGNKPFIYNIYKKRRDRMSEKEVKIYLKRTKTVYDFGTIIVEE